MNQYPLWKYLLILIVVGVCAIYALPNLYGEDPSVQVSGVRTTRVDAATQARLEAVLSKAGLTTKSAAIDGNQLLVRFHNAEDQIKAVDLAQAELGSDYLVALNLAPATPGWLRALNALPMYLGLDLRGGVHFLLEVDMQAALRQSLDRYAGDLRSAMRDAKVRYTSVQAGKDSITVQFKDAETRLAGRNAIHEVYRPLLLTDVDGKDGFVLEVRIDEPELRELHKFALQQNITTLRNRVNELGVAEPIIQQQGDSRIVVQLPGVQDTVRAKKILGATATLEYRLVDTEHSPQEAAEGRVPPGSKLYKTREGEPVLLKKGVIVTGDQITDASSGLDQQNGQPAVYVNLDSKGARKMGDTTKENLGKPMAVVFIENRTETRMVNGKPERVTKVVEEVINVATIRDVFSNRFQTTGLDSTEEAHDLALLLRAGAMAVPSQIIEERTIGPSLGQDNIDKGVFASLIGFVLVIMFMAAYYKGFGMVANVALALNFVLIVAIMSMLQATLTLPGIAGIVLSVGMAVDANVLINERIREELRNGNSPQASINAGYERAFTTIADSNITTLIAAMVLFSFGSGPVKGFAVTLSIGILTSMFTAIMGTRAIINLIYGGRRVARLSI